MRPEPLSGVGRLLRLLRARAFGCPGNVCARDVRRVFVSALCFLGLRCADAGHPPGLFAERAAPLTDWKRRRTCGTAHRQYPAARRGRGAHRAPGSSGCRVEYGPPATD